LQSRWNVGSTIAGGKTTRRRIVLIGSWRSFEAVEFAPLTRVDWFLPVERRERGRQAVFSNDA
jgi:hypothetical protein